MPHLTSYNYIFLGDFIEKPAFSVTFKSMSKENYLFMAPFLCIPGGGGGFYDSQATNRSLLEGGGVLPVF
jgi:hypothetical protein